MLPEARGTVLTYWLRIAPLDLAVSYLHTLHQRGKIVLPAPDAPGKYFGMRVDLAAEMEYFSPEDRLSLQRILFYGRGGFDAIDPRHFPYRQPDFRDPELIAKTGDQPVPFMLLLRRVGREREARLPIDEAGAVMQLLYDDFADVLRADAPGQQPRRGARPPRGAARARQERRRAAAAPDRRARSPAPQAPVPLRRLPASLWPRSGDGRRPERRDRAGGRRESALARRAALGHRGGAREDAALRLCKPRQGLRSRGARAEETPGVASAGGVA